MYKSKELPIVYFSVLIFFCFNLTNNFSSSHDSINYLVELEQGTNLFYSHHLLYHIFTHNFLKLITLFFPNLPSHYILEFSNSLWGAGIITIIFLFFRNRYKCNLLFSIGASSIPLFSFGVWFYSTNIEVYMPAILFLLSSLYVLTRPDFTKKNLYISILLQILAILFHQFSILFTPTIIYFIYDNKFNLNWKKEFLKYAVYGSLSVTAVYLLIGILIEGHSNSNNFINWILGYTKSELYWFPLNFQTLLKAFSGFAHSIIGGHFIFKIKLIQSKFSDFFFYHNLRDEIFLVRNLSEDLALFLLILTISLVITTVFLTWQAIKIFKFQNAYYKRIFKSLFLTFICYSSFFIFWMPENLEFWIFQSILFWLIVLGLIHNTEFRVLKKTYFLVFLISISLFIINYFGSIKWLKDINNDFYYIKTNEILKIINKSDLYITNQNWIFSPYIQRYGEIEVMIFTSDKNNENKYILEKIIRHLEMNKRVLVDLDELFRKSDQWSSFIDHLKRTYQGNISIENLEFSKILIIKVPIK